MVNPGYWGQASGFTVAVDGYQIFYCKVSPPRLAIDRRENDPTSDEEVRGERNGRVFRDKPIADSDASRSPIPVIPITNYDDANGAADRAKPTIALSAIGNTFRRT